MVDINIRVEDKLPPPNHHQQIPYFHIQTIRCSSGSLCASTGMRFQCPATGDGVQQEIDTCLCLTRSKIADAMPFCFNNKSNNQSKGNNSLILQSSTIALLFIPPAQFNSTSPRTRPCRDSDFKEIRHKQVKTIFS